MSTPDQMYELREAAEKGDYAAAAELGALLFNEGAYEEADFWLLQAAEAGQSIAAVTLGAMRVNQGLTQEAETWFRRSAEAGNVEGAARLGVLLLHRERYDEAEHWLRIAAEAGNKDFMGALGYALMKRNAVQEATHWLRQAAEAGDEEAGKRLRAVQAEYATGVEGWMNRSFFLRPTKLRWGGAAVLAVGVFTLFAVPPLGVVLLALAIPSLYLTRFGTVWATLSPKQKALAAPGALIGYLALSGFLLGTIFVSWIIGVMANS